MKKYWLLSVLLLLAIPAQAQVDWGARVGIADGDAMIGIELLTPIGAGFMLNPSLEFTSDMFIANADAHYDFRINPTTDVWLGGGLTFVKPDEGVHDDDGGFNVHTGVGMRRARFYPYGQLKYTSLGDLDSFGTLVVGVRF